MTKPANRKDFELDRLLHPSGAFRKPMDVVSDPDLTTYEKRAILASWASDACAVEDSPSYRRSPWTPMVTFDEIMDALKKLDGDAPTRPRYERLIDRARRVKNLYRSNDADPPLSAL